MISSSLALTNWTALVTLSLHPRLLPFIPAVRAHVYIFKDVLDCICAVAINRNDFFFFFFVSRKHKEIRKDRAESDTDPLR